MTLYRLRPDNENYMSFFIDNDELSYKMGEDIMIHFDPTPYKYAKFWNKPDSRFYKPDSFPNADQIPDITTWAYYLIFNEKAYEKLSTVLGSQGEFLPVNCEGYTYYIFNTLVIADDLGAVNHEKSERDIIDGVYMGLKRLEFIEENLKDTLLFKTAYDFYPVFCTEKFKQLIDENDLKGLIFRTDLEGMA